MFHAANWSRSADRIACRTSSLAHLLRLRKIRVRPLLLVVHKFMSPDELATPMGRERLDACVFKLPVGGRMVSMCEMNATGLRRELNMERLAERFTGRSPGRSTASRTV